jgi:hypothetical protein
LVLLTSTGVVAEAVNAAVRFATRHDAQQIEAAQSTTTTRPPPTEPGGGDTLFPSHRLVAFYGVPGSPRLGVLGEDAPDPLWARLTEAAAPFTSPDVVVVPTYELVAFIALASAGPDGTYSSAIPSDQIDLYLQVVHAHGGMLILDIQPGLGDLLADAQALEPWLVHADVGLALDPEWELQPGQRPNKQIGRTTAAEINKVSAWLEDLTVAHNLPQKLLIVHQFVASMVENKADVTMPPNLAITFNMDGFGRTANKLSVYQSLAGDTRWPLGYKLFYTRDQPLQKPEEILALSPVPQVIEYE